MPNYLDAVLAADAAGAFTDAEFGFAEQVTYNPHNGTPRVVNAVVQRDPPVEVDTVAGARRPKMIVHLTNDPVLGVATVDSGADTITVAYRIGGTPQTFAVGAPITQDMGMISVPLT